MLSTAATSRTCAYGLEIVELSDLAAQTEFKVFQERRRRPAAKCAA